eukprot:g43011.t1
MRLMSSKDTAPLKPDFSGSWVTDKLEGLDGYLAWKGTGWAARKLAATLFSPSESIEQQAEHFKTVRKFGRSVVSMEFKVTKWDGATLKSEGDENGKKFCTLRQLIDGGQRMYLETQALDDKTVCLKIC